MRVSVKGILLLGGAIFLLFLTPATSAQRPSPEEEKKEFLTAEELIKTKAGTLYVTRRFEEALAEFRKLEREYRKDIQIKRYIGACLDHLRRDEEAIAAFKAALKLDPADLPSRQSLGKIYLREGELDNAEKEFTFLVENDRTGTFAPSARVQVEAIRKLREGGEEAREAPGRKITPDEFLQTKAAKLFMNAKYEEALQQFGELAQKYPDDVLVKRYQGITLDKLGHFDEAVAGFQSGLAVAPENIPLHYFLAQSHLHKSEYEIAKQEFQYVVDHDVSQAYQPRAQAEIQGIQQILEALKKAVPRKWTFSASSGAEWSSNPTSNSMRKIIKTAPDVSAWKFSSSAGGNYEVLKRGRWSGKLNYDYSQALYTDSVSQLSTISNAAGVKVTYNGSLRGRPLVVQTGHTTTYTVIRTKSYSTAYAQSLALIYSPWDRYRMTVNEKWSFTAYDGDGTNPDSTGRDGFGNVVSVTNHFYLNDAKTKYFTGGFEYGRDHTQGINYVKNIFSGSTSFHFPLFFKMEGDLNYKFKHTEFPKYGFPAPHTGREDSEHTLGFTLSRPLNRNWKLKGSYGFTFNNSRDGNFAYRNHTLSTSLSYDY